MKSCMWSAKNLYTNAAGKFPSCTEKSDHILPHYVEHPAVCEFKYKRAVLVHGELKVNRIRKGWKV